MNLSFDLLAAELEPASIDPVQSCDFRQAAVLAILYPVDGELSIPLIERPVHQRNHPGQIALPGGARDAVDASLVETAIREAHEEIGIHRADLVIAGRLPSVAAAVSGFIVSPFVAWCEVKPSLTLNASEVVRVVEMPVSVLTVPGNVVEQPAPEGSAHDTIYSIRLPEATVWGLTARILTHLSSAIRAAQAQAGDVD